MKNIRTHCNSYCDLLKQFGTSFRMPPVWYAKGDVYEYRCPYPCSANAKCFAAASPEPLHDGDILNVKCRLCGNQKIPIYAGEAVRTIK